MNRKKKYLPSERSFVEKFFVMDVLSKAKSLEQKGKKIFHLELGEPINTIPQKIKNEANKLYKKKISGYTPSNGIAELRNKISEFYSKKNIKIDPNNIFVTVGSSGAFLLTFLSCFDPGDKVAIFNPSYPAYKNILNSLNIEVIEINSEPKDFFINPKKIEEFKKIDGLIISSPNNPNGQIFSIKELEYLYHFCKKNNIILISDEIYHGIEFEKKAYSLKSFGNDVIVINSFSKFFCLPGWRIGWAVIPDSLIENFLKLAQNLFISCGNIAQYLAIKSFDCLVEYEKNVKIYQKNRDYVFKKLDNSSWTKYTKTQGSFYTYIDVNEFTKDSKTLVRKILNESGVALTPGLDFDSLNGNRSIRLSFSSSFYNVKNGMDLLVKWIKKNH